MAVLTTEENHKPPFLLQVHPEGKFVVDVDKNIDINDVSVAGNIVGGGAAPPPYILRLPPLPPGDTQLSGGSKK